MTDTTTILALVAAGLGAAFLGALWMWIDAKRDYGWALRGWEGAEDACAFFHNAEIAAVKKLADHKKATAAERSRRTSKGNRTRYAKRRALVAAKTAELMGVRG